MTFMLTCMYLYELQNSPAAPSPGCSVYLDVRDLVAVTGLALCPREPAMDQVLQHCVYLAQQVLSEAGKGPDNSVLEQEQKKSRTTICFSACL